MDYKKISHLSDEIQTLASIAIFNDDVITSLKSHLQDSEQAGDIEDDNGSVFGVDVGLVSTSAYNEIMNILIADKIRQNDNLNEDIEDLKNKLVS